MKTEHNTPEGKCCAKDCQNTAKFWYGDSLFCHCGKIECVEKVHNQLEDFKLKINDINEIKHL